MNNYQQLCHFFCVKITYNMTMFILKIPYYTSSLCYQYQTSASPVHCYSEGEQRGLSPPLEVSEAEDESEDHNRPSIRKDTSEYCQFKFPADISLNVLTERDGLTQCPIFQSR